MFTALVSMGYFGNSARSYFVPSEVFLIAILKALGMGQRQPACKEKMERNCWIPSSLALICFANFEGLKFIFEVQWDLCILNSHVGQKPPCWRARDIVDKDKQKQQQYDDIWWQANLPSCKIPLHLLLSIEFFFFTSGLFCCKEPILAF